MHISVGRHPAALTTLFAVQPPNFNARLWTVRYSGSSRPRLLPNSGPDCKAKWALP